MLFAIGSVISREMAIALAETKWWEGMSDREVATFQLFESKLCMPFSLFHKAVEGALDRPVFTHEFAGMKDLQLELLGNKPQPSFEEIMNLIPEEKRVIIFKK